MDLRKYAVYKDDKAPWTVEEVKLIAKSMGKPANTPLSLIGLSNNKYVYLSSVTDEVLPFNTQRVGDKTKISFDDYKNLVTSFNNLKMGTKVLITDTWRPGAYQNSQGKMDKYLGKLVTVTKIHNDFFNTFSIEEDYGMWTWHPEAIECIVDDGAEMPTKNLCSEIFSEEKLTMQKKELTMQKQALQSLFLGELFTESKKAYLSVIVKNGQANVKSLIHQAFFTEIEDPREYVQDLIKRELNRLTAELSSLNLDNIDYGYNIKLAAQVIHFKRYRAALNKSGDILDLENAVNFYRLKKEIESYSKLRASNKDICPFAWIAKHLTHALLNKRGTHTLFKSNKIEISLQDGNLIIEIAEEAIYVAPIKLTVATNTYSI